ncbi:hypothetical protein EYF80_062575 [Liparis tanakae]|uniref:Uncharacterized protein n=1 Tax=Liparis tanakae TaxID=230148 RepID=A0A4Z2EF01_9TELE|nr:hypothetical protein EYF80_062575 [Liparis tanakae]
MDRVKGTDGPGQGNRWTGSGEPMDRVRGTDGPDNDDKVRNAIQGRQKRSEGRSETQSETRGHHGHSGHGDTMSPL